MPDAPAPQPRGMAMAPKPEPMLSRREFIRNSVRLAVVGAVLPGTLTQLLPAVAPAGIGGGGKSPVIIRDPKTNAKKPVTVADLKEQPANMPLVGEWNFLPATVYMVKVDSLKGSADFHKYNTAQYAVQHPGNSKYAILVYRAKCKHLGCTVGWNGGLGGAKPEAGLEDYDGDGINDGRILCPCHQGQYDIYNLARNQPATPPPEPLNVIRFNIGDFAADEERKIPGASQVVIGTELVTQAKYRDADLDSKAGVTEFRLGSQAAKLGGA